MSLAEGHGDGVGVDAASEARWDLTRAGEVPNPQEIALLDTKSAGRLRMDFDPVAPDNLAHGVGDFLQPRAISAPPVKNLQGRIGYEPRQFSPEIWLQFLCELRR